MADTTLHTQLTKYLTDVHAIEQQALAQLKAAPDMAGDERLAAIFEQHLRETEDQEGLVRSRLEQRDAKPSVLKDVAGRVGGWGMVLFARANPDTPGMLVVHAFSYAHMELAAYELLRRVAERAGDADTALMARQIGEQERAMADRLAATWDVALDAALREKDPDDLDEQLHKYLRDAHALEAQALQLLEAGPKLAGFDALATVFEAHLEQTREHQRLVEERLSAHETSPSRAQSAALRAGALNLGTFFKAQPDTPAKLAGFAYAFEGLEIGGYEMLRRMAQRAGDEATALVATQILAEEQAAAEQVAGTWDAAIDAALEARGATRQ